jgi:putative DNA primase/helicase
MKNDISRRGSEVEMPRDNEWKFNRFFDRVFPVRVTQDPNNPNKYKKVPLTEHGFKDASSDPEQIAAWEKQFPGTSWGFPTSNELFMLDPDKLSGGLESWAELTAIHGEPDTYTVRTIGGGKHYWFRAVAGMKVSNSTSKFAPGIDVRGEGGFAVIPPSTGYEVINDADPMVAPMWVVQRLLNMNNPMQSNQQMREKFSLPERVVDGQRNDILFRYGSSLRAKGADEDEIRQELYDVRDTRFERPETFSDEEVDTIIAQVLRYEKGSAPINPDTALSLTDTGNAERLVRMYGDVMRHNREFKWIIWNGKKWVIESPHALQRAQDVAKSIFSEAGETDDADLRKKIFKHAENSLSTRYQKAMLEAAEGLLYTDKTGFDDNHKWMLNVENGVLDLKTGLLLPHDPKYRMTKIAGTHYDPTADAPKWREFMEMIYPDPEIRKYVQKAVGYSLTGNSDDRAIYFLEGESGNNGKSTFVNTLVEMFGEYAATTNIEVITSTGKGASPMNEKLYNARFVATDELPANATWGTNKIKALTGDDEIQVNPKFRKPFSFKPTHHLWIFGNSRPTPDNPDDQAFWSRMKRIVFDQEIPAEVRRPLEEVTAEFRAELAGILNWALEGLHIYLKEGWKVPQALTDAVEEYKSEHDYLAQFIEDYGYVVTGDEKDTSILREDFVNLYNQFLKLAGQPALTGSKVTRELNKKYKGKVVAGGNARKFYVGIRNMTGDEIKASMQEQSPMPTLDPHANDPVDDEDENEVPQYTGDIPYTEWLKQNGLDKNGHRTGH